MSPLGLETENMLSRAEPESNREADSALVWLLRTSLNFSGIFGNLSFIDCVLLGVARNNGLNS